MQLGGLGSASLLVVFAVQLPRSLRNRALVGGVLRYQGPEFTHVPEWLF
jgi:hypothetical protein